MRKLGGTGTSAGREKSNNVRVHMIASERDDGWMAVYRGWAVPECLLSSAQTLRNSVIIRIFINATVNKGKLRDLIPSERGHRRAPINIPGSTGSGALTAKDCLARSCST